MNFVSTSRLGSRIARSTLQKRAFSAPVGPEAYTAIREEAKTASETWKKVTLFITVPLCLVYGAYAYNREIHHLEHYEEHPPEYIPYPYLGIHKKNFPWGDGTKTLFYNEKFNPSEKS
ncbi:hypothetical protein BB560_006820 [Smittium megazygosporum]|uniref:Cytochrome c oxidase polypeptide VIa n=1 Tax=Smittium megazygosporum TaxID=133381 RepID=A0A2T9Y186_9FUNG|nr:hypothetical protein BB560_006820 [Smittium megazygosporum]